MLLAMLRNGPSGRACAEFGADETALGHLISALGSRAPLVQALFAVSSLLDFVQGGTPALQNCERAVRQHGVAAAVTRAVRAVFAAPSSDNFEELQHVCCYGVGLLALLRTSGCLDPAGEDTAQAREAVAFVHQQLLNLRDRVAASGEPKDPRGLLERIDTV